MLQETHNAQRGRYKGQTMSTRRLFAAVRDLDPPGGGAERSLAALLNGIAVPGPTLETAPTFVPMSPAPETPTHPAWTVSALASNDRGEQVGLLNPEVDFTTTDLAIEGFWSKVAWGLRERKGEQRRRKWAHMTGTSDAAALSSLRVLVLGWTSTNTPVPLDSRSLNGRQAQPKRFQNVVYLTSCLSETIRCFASKSGFGRRWKALRWCVQPVKAC